MSLVALDTDVASTLLRRRLPDTLAHQLNGNVLAITFVTVGEITKWTLVRHWGPQRLDTMRNFLAGLVVLPYDRPVAGRWGDSRPEDSYADGRAQPTTPGSPPDALSAICRTRHSTSRTTPTSPTTKACNSSADRHSRGMARGMN